MNNNGYTFLAKQTYQTGDRQIRQTEHIIMAPKIIRFVYNNLQPTLPIHSNYIPSIDQTDRKVNTQRMYKDTKQKVKKLNVVSRTTLRRDHSQNSKVLNFQGIKRSVASFKIQGQSKLNQSQIVNHLNADPIFPLFNCGACCNQQYDLKKKSGSAILSSNSNHKSKSSELNQEEPLNKEYKNMANSQPNKIFDDLQIGLQSSNINNHSIVPQNILSPQLEYNSPRFSQQTTLPIRKKIFNQNSPKKAMCPIRIDQEAMVFDIPSIILSKWQAEQQTTEIKNTSGQKQMDENIVSAKQESNQYQ